MPDRDQFLYEELRRKYFDAWDNEPFVKRYYGRNTAS